MKDEPEVFVKSTEIIQKDMTKVIRNLVVRHTPKTRAN